jgi:hypothetical protein
MQDSLEVSNTYFRLIIFNNTLWVKCGLTRLRITVIKVKYVRIAVKTTIDTIYLYTLSTNQLRY